MGSSECFRSTFFFMAIESVGNGVNSAVEGSHQTLSIVQRMGNGAKESLVNVPVPGSLATVRSYAQISRID